MKTHNRKGSVYLGREALTKTERVFLTLFTVERLSLRLAAKRRNCSLENARRFRAKLVKKGWMDARYNPVVPGKLAPQPWRPEAWTLHALEYVVNILSFGDRKSFVRRHARTTRSVKGSNVHVLDDRLHIQVGQVFEADDPDKAAWKAAEYVFSLLRLLERDIGVLLLKDRSANIKRVAGEFSHMNDDLALQPGAAQIKVYAGDDGDLRVKVDWSPGTMPEVEYPHSVHGQSDAGVYRDFLTDLVERQHYSMSELTRITQTSIEMHARAAAQLELATKQIQLSAEQIASLALIVRSGVGGQNGREI